ncbi:hypothetical protein INT47_006498, partial [Mucor saturninus]
PSVVKEIQRINEREITSGTWSESASWHVQYKDTAWIFAGNLPFELTEGDVVCIFSQYGEIIHIELIRDHKTGKSKGFAFIQYEDQRSTVLAVLGRTLRVDHSFGPKKQKKREGEEESDDDQPKMNVAPELVEVVEKEKSKPKPKPIDVDEEDPMAAYFRDKKEKKSKKKSSKHHKSSKEEGRSHRKKSRSPIGRSRSRSPIKRRSRSPMKRRSRSPVERRRRSRSPVERKRKEEEVGRPMIVEEIDLLLREEEADLLIEEVDPPMAEVVDLITEEVDPLWKERADS